MTSAGRPEQLAMMWKEGGIAANGPEVPDIGGPETPWLGLIVNHRRLFDVLQDGWLRPLPPSTGLLIGAGAYAPEQEVDRAEHSIPIRIKLSVEKLPDLEVSVFRGERWAPSRLDGIGPSDLALYWPGMLPTFAISELAVSTEEERARLVGMARRFSNVELPDVSIKVDTKFSDDVSPSIPPPEISPSLVTPASEDSIHGAMSMAVWAVPRIGPWLDVLTTSLSSDRARLPSLAAEVEAEWWRFPPWAEFSGDRRRLSLQDCLWLAATDVFRARPIEDHGRPRALAERIATTATSRYGCPGYEDEISAWLRTTHSILRAESPLRYERRRACPVGMAIQLVLARPEPTTFKTWSKVMPDLPPAVWWSAAVLCGLYHGYRRLDTRFRGQEEQRELLSVHALRACAAEAREIRWPPFTSGEPGWRREGDGFVLLWGDRKIAHKPAQVRGRWLAADFEDPNVLREAQAVAKDLEWSCLNRELRLMDGRLPVSGPGKVKILNRGLDIQGCVRIRLPSDASIEDVLDVESFRRHVTVAAGRLPEPPAPRTSDLPIHRLEVPSGLTYVPDFLSEAEEKKLIDEIDRCDWSEELQRRVQHYGWRYDYKARHVDSTMRLGDLPKWAGAIAKRLVEERLVSALPDQVIVNEYVGAQGISRHVDSESSFADGIATLSLLESWEMVFREKGGKRKVERKLDRRSVAVLAGEARYHWTHEIPQRKTEPGVPRVKRGRRLSLTFRKVIEEERR